MPFTRAEATAPRRRPVRRPAVAALLLSGSLLTGCQANPEPPPLARTATSTSSSPSPTEAAPTMPPEARGTSKAAAEAFVRYWITTVNYAMRSGDTGHLRSLAEAECRSCEVVADNIQRTYEAGGMITSRGWVLQTLSVVPQPHGDHPILDLGVVMTPERVVERKGAEPKTFRGGKQPMTIFLSRVHGEWEVYRWDLVS